VSPLRRHYSESNREHESDTVRVASVCSALKQGLGREMAERAIRQLGGLVRSTKRVLNLTEEEIDGYDVRLDRGEGQCPLDLLQDP